MDKIYMLIKSNFKFYKLYLKVKTKHDLRSLKIS